MSSDYDVIVIGGRSPGEHCAGALAEGGLRVGARAGGERVLLLGLHPSKTLLRPGEAVHGANDAAGSTVVEAQGSHAIYVSKPEAVAALIEKAAKGVKSAAR